MLWEPIKNSQAKVTIDDLNECLLCVVVASGTQAKSQMVHDQWSHFACSRSHSAITEASSDASSDDVTHPIVSFLWLSDSTGHLCWSALYRSTWSHHVLWIYHFHGVLWTFHLHSSRTNTSSPPDRVARSASGPCIVGPGVWKHSRQISSLYLCSHVAYWVTEKKHVNQDTLGSNKVG